jgi:hypothetical protein
MNGPKTNDEKLLLLSQFQLVEFGINGVPANAAWSVAIAR